MYDADKLKAVKDLLNVVVLIINDSSDDKLKNVNTKVNDLLNELEDDYYSSSMDC